MKRHELTDEQWALVQRHLPRSAARTGRPASDRRTQLNGIFWILATGAPWRDLPERFGPWQTVYDHFRKWRKSGVFASIIEALQVKLDKDGYIDWGLWCVDGSSVRAARAAAGADKKVSPATPTNLPTTHWAAAAAGLAVHFHGMLQLAMIGRYLRLQFSDGASCEKPKRMHRHGSVLIRQTSPLLEERFDIFACGARHELNKLWCR